MLEHLTPLSCYGRLRQERMPVYLPGCEHQLTREWERIGSLLDVWQSYPEKVQAVEAEIHGLRDIRGIVRKACAHLTLEEHELFDLKQWLQQVDRLSQTLVTLPSFLPRRFSLYCCPRLLASLSMEGDSGFYLADCYDPKLASLRQLQRQKFSVLSEIKEKRQACITRETGLEFNYQGCLRVGKHQTELLDKLHNRSDLLTVAETYTEVEFTLRKTAEMLELSRQIADLEQEIQQQEYIIRQVLTEQVARHSRWLLASCNRIGAIDLLFAKGRLARELGGCVPTLVSENKLQISALVHPLVENQLASQGLVFQPLDINVVGKRVTLITGANMGGKSVALKSIGLAVAMAQRGLLVPARRMEFSLRSFVYYSQQEENPRQGLSTFGAEIHSLAQMLPRHHQPGLYLLDEPARGTNPHEGAGLVAGIINWLVSGNSLAIIATHLSGLTEGAAVDHLQVAGLSNVEPDQLNQALAGGRKSLQQLMDYTLVPSGGDVPRDALKVAAFLGLDREIINYAHRKLGLPAQEVVDDEIES